MLNSIAFIHPTSTFKHTRGRCEWTKPFYSFHSSSGSWIPRWAACSFRLPLTAKFEAIARRWSAAVINGGTQAEAAAANEARWDSGVEPCWGPAKTLTHPVTRRSAGPVTPPPPLSASPRRLRNTSSRGEIGPRWRDAAFQSQHIHLRLHLHLSLVRLHPWTWKAAITDVHAAWPAGEWATSLADACLEGFLRCWITAGCCFQH